MMEYPIISVVIPVYNKGNLFRDTLASALNQIFRDYEIIIVDDGSTDNTRAIVDRFADPKIRYFFQSHSGLPAAARNNGIKLSRGSLIAFLDADDIWYPKKLQKGYEIFREHPNVDLVCNDELMKDSFGKEIKRLRYGPYTTDMFRKLLFHGNCLSPSGTVVKKSALLEVGLFRERRDLFSVEDYDLWLRLSKHHKFYFIPEVLGEFLVHDNNISSDKEPHYKNYIEALKINFTEYDQKRPLDHLLINIVIFKVHMFLIKYFTLNGKYKKSFQIFIRALRELLK